MFCSGCGLCETYSCPQDLSPRAMIAELKNVARAQGYKPPDDIKPDVVKDAEFKKVSVDRLTMRLGLKKYDVPAPISEDFETKNVKLMLSQHLGAPAVAVVKEGDTVEKGDLIAAAKEQALSVSIHASISGKITAVTQSYVKITKNA